MPSSESISDKALAVFAFAAYHQLESGQPVTSVVRQDGSGHEADASAVGELDAHGLARVEGNSICFTEAGLKRLAEVVDGLRRAAAT